MSSSEGVAIEHRPLRESAIGKSIYIINPKCDAPSHHTTEVFAQLKASPLAVIEKAAEAAAV
jgi:hypothetical protein